MRVIWVLLIQERSGLPRAFPRPQVQDEVESLCTEAEEQASCDQPSHTERNPGREECCVCYEHRVPARAKSCESCGARPMVCEPCMRAWTLSSGLRQSCVICRARLSVSTARTFHRFSSGERQEDYLTLFFAIYSFLQYVYVAWFVHAFIRTMQPYLI